MDKFQQLQHEERLKALAVQGIKELKVACREYHQKYSKGPGAAVICICGWHASSQACRGLSEIKDFFMYANWGDPKWKEKFEFLQQVFESL